MKLPVGYVAGQGVSKPTGYGGLGERLLKSMGWERGQGLGKDAQGMKEALDVKKKEDTVGVGGNARWNWEDRWWERTFDSAAHTVDHSTVSDSSTSSSDDDDIDIRRKAEAVDGPMNRDGTATTASIDEIKLLKKLSKRSRLAAGRFSGREGKMARLRAQEASLGSQAISALGLEAGKSQGTVSAPSNSLARASDRSDTTSEAHAAPEEASTAKKRRIVIEPAVNCLTESVYHFQATPRGGWWG